MLTLRASLLSAAALLFLAVGPAVRAVPNALPAGSYIVRLHPGVATDTVSDSIAAFVERSAADGRVVAAEANTVRRTFSHVMNGVAGTFSAEFLAEFQREHAAEVMYIAPNTRKVARGSQKGAPWGLARVSQRKKGSGTAATTYTYPDTAGAGVDVWIVDTGIWQNHTEFGGRAKMTKSFIDGEDPWDLHGHGTHCAGTVGSATYGVAKKANLFGVKVLDQEGSGTDESVIAGIDYVAQNVRAGHTVLSMSLGGDKSQALDDAVNKAIELGVVVVVAAGNESTDACTESPSGAEKVLAVGAIDSTDAMASFSNFGKCTRIFAPGVNVKSLWIGGDGATATISGTSMATPHTAGVAALYMAEKAYSSAEAVYKDLLGSATPGVVTGIPSGDLANNALLYNVVNKSDVALAA